MNKLELIIPVKNEQENIVALCKRIDQVLHKAKITYRLIIIDDHSTDQTWQIIQKLKKDYPIVAWKKKGKLGKGYSILEGAKKAKSQFLGMIDGDNQYPPEALPEMFQKLKDGAGIVVGNRVNYHEGWKRKLGSKLCNWIFGRLLFGFSCDIQSGLKLFRRELIVSIAEKDVTAWTLDLPLLLQAKIRNLPISTVDISFAKRAKGESKVRFWQTAWEIGKEALKWRFLKPHVCVLTPRKGSMQGAGIWYKGRQYITHTTLPLDKSAWQTLTFWQTIAISALVGAIFLLASFNLLLTLQILIAVLTVVYFSDVIFYLWLLWRSLMNPPEISFSPQQLKKIKDSQLPVYSILCPLYKESAVLPQFVKAIQKLDYPKDKLDVQLLLEEDDHETITAAQRLNLPSYFRLTIVPHSLPKTKPKACNFGLNQAKGEYLVIYDAEDIPDPLQLKKVYLAFQQAPPDIICFQCKLNYYNPKQNLLTKLFTAEYSLWFDLTLPGLQSLNTIIPLGGTSNHFRLKDLRRLQGWDPFNVTEDADLGVRLFKAGYKTAIIDSTTYEEANSRLKNWVRQRSRWIKGYLQTYFVHLRDPWNFFRRYKHHMVFFQLVVGGKVAFLFLNPILWVTTLTYFLAYAWVGETIERLFPSFIFYLAAFCLVFGNFAFLYSYMIAVLKRKQYWLVKYIYLKPFYWLLTSYAALVALYQLIIKPYYWEKTVHGFHLQPLRQKFQPAGIGAIPPKPVFSLPSLGVIGGRLRFSSFMLGSAAVSLATLWAHFANFLLTTTLNRFLSWESFGIYSLFSSFLLIFAVPNSAISATATKQVAHLLKNKQEAKARGLILQLNQRLLTIGLILSLCWLFLTPYLANFFKVHSFLPFILFTPVLMFSLLVSNGSGFFRGKLSFAFIAFVTGIIPMIKLALVYILLIWNLTDWVVLVLAAAVMVELLINYLFLIAGGKIQKTKINWDQKFFFSSLVSQFSASLILAVDVILAKKFLDPLAAGQYSLLNLVGKIVFFGGSLLIPFILPLVIRSKNSQFKVELYLLFGLILTSLASLFLAFGIFGGLTVPLLFGNKALAIVPLLPSFVAAVSFFTLANAYIQYHQAKERYEIAIPALLVIPFQIMFATIWHQTLERFVFSFVLTSGVYILALLVLTRVSNLSRVLSYNLQAIFSLFKKESLEENSVGLRILIFNWRDLQHKWAGGAEVYVHQLAKQMIRSGHQVTLFCGNDGTLPNYQIVDGIEIFRRGGTYTVYLFAFLYYLFRFHHRYDLIIDCENGIPFFTPLYSSTPKILVIHHIHQEILHRYLRFPLNLVAQFLESHLMPWAYQNVPIVTVSPSTEKEILKIGMGEAGVTIIHNGVEPWYFCRLPKTSHPSFCYVGRLKPYKNVDIAIKAFVKVLEVYPQAKFYIAGTGESFDDLKKLTEQLNLQNSVFFLGKISNQEKVKLYAQSWVAIQPSSIEGWGITVIEANAAGTPVIAARVNGLKDSVVDQQTGLLVHPSDPNALAQAMILLIKDSKLRAYLGANAIKFARNFTWEKSGKGLLQLIYQLVGQPQPLPSVVSNLDLQQP